MSLLDFDKNSLTNLEYSLQREMLGTNRIGAYMSTTIVCCNTRKYHGLMVCPVGEGQSEGNYLLLSALDETVIQQDQAFNLAIRKYPGTYEPRGHKYITDFSYTPTPTITYRVGGVTLQKELLWMHSKMQLMIRYRLLEATLPIKLRLAPLLAYRDKHSLTRANQSADTRAYPIEGGVRSRLYDGFPWLNMQTSRESLFVEEPRWLLNVEYMEEMNRGYPYQEDLLATGYFECELEKGESVIFSSAFEPVQWREIEREFEKEFEKRSNKVDMLSCLQHSARQFIVKRGDKSEVVAGYPWFGRWGRDTFIALPGLTLTQGRVEECLEVIDTMTSEMVDGMFPNMGSAYNSVDAPLWFFWTLQQLEGHIGAEAIWKRYGGSMKSVLESYRAGSEYVAVHENGLVWASHPTLAMTWMDAVVDGRAVTGRDGYQVEINALWYNAICYTLELAKRGADREFVERWCDMPERVKSSFLLRLWNDGYGSLADYYVDEGGQNMLVRPNQVIACSLNYKMVSDNQILSILRVVKEHLLTPKGLRTLSPRNENYQGHIDGDQPTRDRAYHQGTVWPWLLEHYVAANFHIYGAEYSSQAKIIVAGFEEEMTSYGIGSIAEIYDGDPPHNPKGAPSQAWSVAAILRIIEMAEMAEKESNKER